MANTTHDNKLEGEDLLQDTSKENSTMHRRVGNHNQIDDGLDKSEKREAEKAPEDGKKLYNRVRVLFSHHRWACFLSLVILILSVLSNNRKPTRTSTAVAKSVNRKKIKPDVSKYSNCTISAPVASSTTVEKKPLWFPSYPTAMGDSIVRDLITKMTGLPAGVKSFYASQKRIGLRHCHAQNSETVACLNIHPLVEMRPPGPDAFEASFDRTVILLMRNPTIVIPAFLNQKRIQYSKKPGQTPLTEWRKSRDDYLEGMWNQWKNQYLTWKNTKHFEVGMYLVYEDLMDPDRGTQAITRVSKLLKKAGFPTIPSEDMACLWYQTFGGDLLDRYYQYRYDYNDYVPGYTTAQKEFLTQEMAALIKEVQEQDDTELVKILEEYSTYLIEELITDEPWVNETANNALSL